MTLQQEALYAVRLLPDEKLPALIAFARFLTQDHSYTYAANPDADSLTQKRRAVSGILRGEAGTLRMSANAVPPLAFGALTNQQRDAEIQKGFDDLDAGRILFAEEVDDAMAREFGV